MRIRKEKSLYIPPDDTCLTAGRRRGVNKKGDFYKPSAIIDQRQIA
jgi:hypothetical protein